MKDRQTTRQPSKPNRCMLLLSGAFNSICFQRDGTKPFISIFKCTRTCIAHHDRSHTAFHFNSHELSLDLWLPFVSLHTHNRQVFPLDERQVKNFEMFFDKMGGEIKTDYVFRNEYLIDLLKPTTTYLGQIANHLLKQP